jgi:Uma2 family endonuclease
VVNTELSEAGPKMASGGGGSKAGRETQKIEASCYDTRVKALPRSPATLADLADARDRGLAVELIDGELVLKAMPRPEHGSSQVKLGEVLGPFNRKTGGPRGPGGWWIMSEVEVLYPLLGEAYRHDLVGFRRDRLGQRPSSLPVRERADWVCEILSPTTARYDIVQKQRTLHAHGVPHYWLVDPEHETLMVLRHGPDAYINILNAGVGDVVRAEPFGDIEIDVGELFGHDAKEP